MSEAKKPCKGILKNSGSFDKAGSSNRKSAKFDELNVLQTFHPPDKDYGHMKVDEPKTPFNYMDPALAEADQLDAGLLSEKLQAAADSRRDSLPEETSDDEDLEMTDDQRASRVEFEKRRKLHYNEFEAIKMARKLIEEDDNASEEDIEIKEVESEENIEDIEAESSSVNLVDSKDTTDETSAP